MADLNRNASGFAAVMSPAETPRGDPGPPPPPPRPAPPTGGGRGGGGLVLGGIAALGLRAVSVTNDVAQASHVIRAGRVIPVPAGLAVQSSDVLLTQVGHEMLGGPLKWAIIFAPLVVVLGLSFGTARLRPATAQLLFWLYAVLIGLSLASIFLFYAHM